MEIAPGTVSGSGAGPVARRPVRYPNVWPSAAEHRLCGRPRHSPERSTSISSFSSRRGTASFPSASSPAGNAWTRLRCTATPFARQHETAPRRHGPVRTGGGQRVGPPPTIKKPSGGSKDPHPHASGFRARARWPRRPLDDVSMERRGRVRSRCRRHPGAGPWPSRAASGRDRSPFGLTSPASRSRPHVVSPRASVPDGGRLDRMARLPAPRTACDARHIQPRTSCRFWPTRDCRLLRRHGRTERLSRALRSLRANTR